jgi:hypothetical protein
MSEATSAQNLSRIEAEREGDQRTDAKAILVIFCTAIAMAVHFISGWTF